VAAIPETRLKQRILVVDDQGPVLETLGAMLTNAGYRFYGVLSGAQALSAARLTVYDAALIDIHMPVMDGFETALRLREFAERRGRAMRMWHITGMDNPTYPERSARCGMMGLLLKPFNSADLCAALESGFSSPIPPLPADVSPSPGSSTELKRETKSAPQPRDIDEKIR
jgi:CheY-like chemotaxis protein